MKTWQFYSVLLIVSSLLLLSSGKKERETKQDHSDMGIVLRQSVDELPPKKEMPEVVNSSSGSDHHSRKTTFSELLLPPKLIGSVQYKNGKINVYDGKGTRKDTIQSNESKDLDTKYYYYNPIASIVHSKTHCSLNPETNQAEMKFSIEMWNADIQHQVLTLLQNKIGEKVQNSQIRVIPHHTITLNITSPVFDQILKYGLKLPYQQQEMVYLSVIIPSGLQECHRYLNSMRNSPHLFFYKLVFRLFLDGDHYPNTTSTTIEPISETTISTRDVKYSTSTTVKSTTKPWTLTTVVGNFYVFDKKVFEFSNKRGDDWLVQTQTNRILFISFPESMDNSEHELFKDSLMIYDGVAMNSSRLLYPSKQENGTVNSRFYSTGSTVFIRFRRFSGIDKFKLNIQKAVECPINLGGSSSCGRVVDPVSCYCATFDLRTWAQTRAFCHSKNKMTFYRIDNHDQDLAVYTAFGRKQVLWIGAADTTRNSAKKWIWDNGGKLVSDGYTNWAPGQPDNFKRVEYCMEYHNASFGWGDGNCLHKKGGICEAQP